VNDTGRPKQSNRTKRAIAAGYAALVSLSQSRGVFAVIGAAAATSIFVLVAWLPGNDFSLQSPPAFADRTGNVDEKAGTDADNGAAQTSQGSRLEPGRSSAQPPAPLAGSALVEPAPGEPAPSQQAQPIPGVPVPGEPTPRTPPGPPVIQQEKRVVLSTKAGRESVGIDQWQKVNSESDDLRMDPDGIYTTMGAQLSVVEDPHETIAYHDCAQRTTWVTRVEFSTLHKGSAICARSRTGSYAALKVINLPPSTRNHDRFVFQGTTWQLPGQPSPRHLPPAQAPSEQSAPPDPASE
jgi:hypothetical protein